MDEKQISCQWTAEERLLLIGQMAPAIRAVPIAKLHYVQKHIYLLATAPSSELEEYRKEIFLLLQLAAFYFQSKS